MSRRRIDTREYQWWGALAAWAAAHGIVEESPDYDALFDIVLAAINEAGPIEAASRGGIKGAAQRTANMTPAQRSQSASKAARARWAKESS